MGLISKKLLEKVTGVASESEVFVEGIGRLATKKTLFGRAFVVNGHVFFILPWDAWRLSSLFRREARTKIEKWIQRNGLD